MKNERTVSPEYKYVRGLEDAFDKNGFEIWNPHKNPMVSIV